MRWAILGYKIGGAFLLFATAAMLGSAVNILLNRDAEGWDAFAAAIGGLVWGAAVGLVAAIVFVFLPVPNLVKDRWWVLGSLLLAAAGAMTLLEALD